MKFGKVRRARVRGLIAFVTYFQNDPKQINQNVNVSSKLAVGPWVAVILFSKLFMFKRFHNFKFNF
jgi:hypothetical protein